MFTKIKQSFSLIELVVTVAILAILAAIVIPNVSDMREESFVTAIKNNTRNAQTAVDKFYLDNEKYPSNVQPTVFEPSAINWDILYPQYIKDVPEDLDKVYYWIDAFGKVWGSTVDAPKQVQYKEDSITWENDTSSTGYEIFAISVPNPATTKANNARVSIRKVDSVRKRGEKVMKYMNTSNEAHIISAFDQYGLPTAPVGFDYQGFPQKTDNGITLPIIEPGTYYFTTNAQGEAVWDGVKVIEDKPAGTDIKYSFATSNDGTNYSAYTEDFDSLPNSQYLKVKVDIIPDGDNKPVLYRLKVMFHLLSDEMMDYGRFLFPNIWDTLVGSENIKRESIPNFPDHIQIKDGENKGEFSNIISLGALKKVSNVDTLSITPKGAKVEYFYQTSLDGSSYSEPTPYLSDAPPGRYLKITTKMTRSSSGGSDSNGSPMIKGFKVETASPIDVVSSGGGSGQDALVGINDDNWITVDKLFYMVDATDVGDWTGSTIHDHQPANTRILYVYSTSNDGFDFGNYNKDITAVPNSQYLNVDIIKQIKPNATEMPKFYEIIVDYKLNGKDKSKGLGGDDALLHELQNAVYKYYQDKGSYPVQGDQPTITNPTKLDANALYPTYINHVPTFSKIKIWVTATGQLYISSIDAPTNVHVDGSYLKWDPVENAHHYNVYKVVGDKLVFQTTTTDTSFRGLRDQTYVVSAVDNFGNQSAPSGQGYLGYRDNKAPTKPSITAAVIERTSTYAKMTIQGYGSTDPDGDAITYEYDGLMANDIYPNGTYTVKARAVDNYGGVSEWATYTFSTDSALSTIFNTWDNYQRNSNSGQWAYNSSQDWLYSTQNVGWTGFWNPNDHVLNDYELNWEMTVTPHNDNDTIGMTFRMQDINNFYFIAIDDGGAIDGGLYKMTNGSYTRVVDFNLYNWDPDVWKQYKVRLVGNNIQVWAHGNLVANYTDNNNPYLNGGYGPFTYSQANGAFRKIILAPIQ